MPIEKNELQRSLADWPVWKPPAGFAARTVRAASVREFWPPSQRDRYARGRRGMICVVAAIGVACVGFVVLRSMVPAVAQGALAAAGASAESLGLAARAMSSRPVSVAWVSAALSLLFAGSLTYRALRP